MKRSKLFSILLFCITSTSCTVIHNGQTYTQNSYFQYKEIPLGDLIIECSKQKSVIDKDKQDKTRTLSNGQVVTVFQYDAITLLNSMIDRGEIKLKKSNVISEIDDNIAIALQNKKFKNAYDEIVGNSLKHKNQYIKDLENLITKCGINNIKF